MQNRAFFILHTKKQEIMVGMAGGFCIKIECRCNQLVLNQQIQLLPYSLKNHLLEEEGVEENDKCPDEFEEHLQRFGQFSEAVRGRQDGDDSAMGK